MRSAGSSKPPIMPSTALRRSRARRRLFISLLVLTAVVLAGLIAARAAVLRTAIDAGLAAAGMADVRYRIASVGFLATRIVDIQAGPEIAVDEVTLRYHPLRLLKVEIDEVAVRGLRLDLSQGLGRFAPKADDGVSGGDDGA